MVDCHPKIQPLLRDIPGTSGKPGHDFPRNFERRQMNMPLLDAQVALYATLIKFEPGWGRTVEQMNKETLIIVSCV